MRRNNPDIPPQGHIGFLEVSSILIVMTTAKIYLIFTERMLRAGATAAWSIPIIAAALSLVWVVPLVYLLEKYPGQSLIDITRQLAGKPLAWLFGLLLFAYLLVVTATALEEIASVLAIGVLPLSPVRALSVIILAFALPLALFGLEALGRLSIVTAVSALGSILVLALVSTSYWDYDYLFPLQGLGIMSTLTAGAIRQAMYAEFIVIGLLAPYVRARVAESGQIRRSFKWALPVALFIFTLSVLSVQMAFPYPAALNQATPLLSLARQLYLSRFFQRFDALFLFFWIVAAVVQIALGLYFSGMAISFTFSIPNPRPLMMLSAAMSYAFVRYVYNYSLVVALDFDLMRPASTALIYVWVFLLLILSYVRKKPSPKGGEIHAQAQE